MHERDIESTQESYWRRTRPMNLSKFGDIEGWKVSDEYLDIRNWSLLDEDHEEIGTITDYLVDVDAEEVIFLVVNYDNRTTLVPLDQVELSKDDETAVFKLTADHVTSAPVFGGDIGDVDIFYDYWVGMGPITGARPEAEEGRLTVIRYEVVRIMRAV